MQNSGIKEVQYELPEMQSGARTVANAWARVPRELSRQEKQEYREKIKKLLKEKNAVLVAHYYVDGDIQDLAEETGGCVADSLEMARFGRDNPAKTLVVAGVRFMGETAKILSPDKKILMPDLDACCSLDLGCPADEFAAFCDAHPDRTVVVYANTSAAVKARADWMATSSDWKSSGICMKKAKKFSGARIGIWEVIFRNRPVPTCCYGRGPVLSMTNSRQPNCIC